MIDVKCVSAHVEILDDGRSVAPGARTSVDEEQPHNKALLDSGALIRLDGGSSNNDEGKE